MKTKSKHRWLALFMVVAMLIGTLPITVFAEDNTHTEDCYAKAGDLLCTIAESEGHTHTADCVCPGGENICGLKESEGHTHNESCYTYVEDENPKMRKRRHLQMQERKNWYALWMNRRGIPIRQIASVPVVSISADWKKAKVIPTVRTATPRAESSSALLIRRTRFFLQKKRMGTL